MPASAQFFGIPELVAMTLGYVSTLQLLLLQRVNTTFRGIIETSTPLQRRLFFKPDPLKSDLVLYEANPFYSNSEQTSLPSSIELGFGQDSAI